MCPSCYPWECGSLPLSLPGLYILQYNNPPNQLTELKTRLNLACLGPHRWQDRDYLHAQLSGGGETGDPVETKGKMQQREWVVLYIFQNMFLSSATLPTMAVLGCGRGSEALLIAALHFGDSITIWHPSTIAHCRLHCPECEGRKKWSRIFPKALGQCQLKQIIWDLMECQITGCLSTGQIK